MYGCCFRPEELIRVFQTTAVLPGLSTAMVVSSDVNVRFAPFAVNISCGLLTRKRILHQLR